MISMRKQHPPHIRRGRRASMTLGVLLSLGAAQAAPAGVMISNTAQMETFGELWPSPTVTLEVAAVCSVRVTLTSPPANVITGQESQAVFTVFNDGNTEIEFPLTTEVVAGKGQLKAPASVVIPAAASVAVTLFMTPGQAGVMAATLRASCPVGSILNGPAQAESRAVLTAADDSKLSLSKQVEPTTSEDPSVDTSPLEPANQLLERKPGELIRYHLTVSNDGNTTKIATIRDQLPNGLIAVAASPAANSTSGQNLNWSLTLEPGEKRVIHLVARLPQLDDGKVDNVFSAQTGDKTFNSNVATVTMWDPRLTIQKIVSIPEARIGSVLNYAVTTSNASRQATVEQVSMTDTMPRGLQLLDNTLRLNGQPVQDLDEDPQVIHVMGGDLAAGEQHVLTYQAIVTAQANETDDLVNVAVAQGLNANRPVTEEISASAVVKVISAGLGDIIGRVFVDMNGNGTYQTGEPLISGARLILAGGQQALTDREGRYHFKRLIPGEYALSLDPRTVQQFPESVAGDYGRTGSRLLNVWGLTPADFPLKPSQGSAQALRATTLTIRQGSRTLATLTKTVTPVSGGYTVDYRVTGISGTKLKINDPLPELASVISGQTTMNVVLEGGSWSAQTQVSTTLKPESMTTDPTVEVLP